MTTPAHSPAASTGGPDLTERYGRRRPLGKGVWIGAGVVVLLLALAFTYWATVIDQDRVTWQDNSFKVRSASEVSVTFDVQMHAGTKRAICTVHALNSLNTEVGLRDVEVEGGSRGRAQVTVTLTTSEEATTGVVRECVAR